MALKDFSLRIEEELLNKLHYIAKAEDRSANGEILRLIRKHVTNYEYENGNIPDDWEYRKKKPGNTE